MAKKGACNCVLAVYLYSALSYEAKVFWFCFVLVGVVCGVFFFFCELQQFLEG